MSRKKELIEVITNRFNPRYRKEIVPISEEIIPLDILDDDELKSINLRGLNIDIGTFNGNGEYLSILPQSSINDIRSIVKIDENTIACGGRDYQITLLDISDISNIKSISTLQVKGMIDSLIYIDENTIAYGGENKEVVLVDIGDRINMKTHWLVEDEIIVLLYLI